jgi:hypothetical protein
MNEYTKQELEEAKTGELKSRCIFLLLIWFIHSIRMMHPNVFLHISFLV